MKTNFTAGSNTGNQTTWTYDAAGRQNSTSGQFTVTSIPGSFTRQFDIENHIISQAYTTWSSPDQSRLEDDHPVFEH